MAQPSVIDKIMSGASSLVRGTQKLLSPTDIDSQIELSDLQTQPAPETWEDKKLRQLGNQRYEEARQGRFLVNEKIFTGLAFYNGVHDHYYNAGAGRMMPINEGSSDLKERFVYKPKNFIPVYVQRAESRILAEKPDAWAAPMTDSDSDKKAAAIARSCVTHAHRKLNIDALLRQVVRRMLITTTTFIEIGWDNKAYADIGIPQADGSVSYHYEQIGDVCANVRLAIDAYPDPNAALNGKGIDGGAYFVTRSLESIEHIFAKWGKRVEADSQSDVNMWLQQRIEWISGTYTRAASSQKNSAVVTQVWEKPSGQFPKGRFWVYSGETVLHKGPWPYTKGVARHKYPFVEFYYDENVGSIWGLNMVSNLIPIQMAINDQSTYMNGRLAWDRPVILAPRSANIAPDDYNDNYYGKIIPFDSANMGGAPPQWLFPPSPGNLYLENMEALKADMEYMAGVRDFNSDSAPTPNSGKEYELRMNEDKSRLAPVIERMAEGVVKIDEYILALYEQFGDSFPRLLGLADEDVPQRDLEGPNAGTTELADLKALSEGNYRVIMSPGSGQGKSPAAQDERLDEIMGVIGPLAQNPQTLPLIKLYFDQLNDIRSDAQIDRVMTELNQATAQMQANQPNPMAVQQQKDAAAAQSQQSQAQIDIQQAHQESAINIAEAQAKSNIAIAQSAKEQEWEMQRQNVEAANQLRLATFKASTPSVSLTGPLGPVGIASAEKEAGLQSDDTATMQKQLTPPPKPVAGTTTSTNTKG